MPYFETFPLVWHTLPDGDQVLLQNLTRRVMIVDKIKDLEGMLLPYTISDGETPRQFAERVYGSFELFWVTLLINKIVDPVAGWPRPEQRVIDELESSYGIDGMYNTAYYVNEYGIKSDPKALRIAYGLGDMTDDNIISLYSLTPVNYHDDAIAQNDKLRDVKVLHPDYVNNFVSQFEQVMKNG